MKVSDVAIDEVPRASPHDSLATFEEALLEARAVVVEEEGRFLGLLTLADVVERAHVLAIDCLTPKPEVSLEDDIEGVIALMERQNLYSLPVTQQGRFVGVVSYKGIVEGAARQRRKLEVYAARLEHSEALRQLAGGVAHDFNNLAQIVLAIFDRARVEEGVSETVADLLQHAEAAIERTTRLAEQLRSFSHHGTVSRELSSLEELIVANATFLVRSHDAELTSAFDRDLWPCEVERDRFAQVVNNLVINALQACPRGAGRLELSGRNQLVTDADELPLPAGRYVALGFGDNGGGIDRAHLERVFVPFFTTKAAGTGLGLSLVASIVDEHGGYVTVDTTPGQGTTFTVYLPAF